MKKKYLFTLSAVLLLSACNFDNRMPPNGTSFESYPDFSLDDGNESKDAGNELSVVIDESTIISSVTEETKPSKITDLTAEGISYDEANKVFTITQGGEYEFKGVFAGNIVVNGNKDTDEVKITLKGFTISSDKDSPIRCNSAKEFQLSIKNGTENFIYDKRENKAADDDTQGNGAVFTCSDTKVSGKGSLVIVGNYYNGIHCKKDLTLKPEVVDNSSVQIKAYNNCLRGNDSVKITSGNYVLISTSGNGIMTDNTDVSDKGKQRGNIEITGGHIDIYSEKDGIDAAYNVNISKDGDVAPIVNIYTSKYSQYSADTVETSTTKFYLKVNFSINYSSSYYLGVEFMDSSYKTSWVKATQLSSRSRDKYFELSRPTNATSFKVALFTQNVTAMDEASATSIMSSYKTISSNGDTASISVSSSSITFNGMTNYQANQPGGPGGGMSEGNDDKSDVSSKGIKAANEINISDGTFFIKTYDDAIHANYGDTFDNDGGIGLGNVTITGGTFDIYASDDGLHADNTLNIQGGLIDIRYSYEGIEGNIINISGGLTHVYSIDDGLNAANKSNQTPAINVSGGVIDITVNGQDVDGIDSNGSFTQSGGYVITKGGNSNMSTGLDVDGTAKVTGGTFVAFGRTEKTPTKGSGITSYTLSGSYSIGNYSIKFTEEVTVEVSTKYSYSMIYVYSDTSQQITVTKI